MAVQNAGMALRDGLESVKKTHQVARVGKDAIRAGYPPIWTTLGADFG
jgi:hypothetical protein